MRNTNPDPRLLGTIGEIERYLGMLRPANEGEIRLRLKIEEVVEIGYEAIYARPRLRNTATVLNFPSAGAAR